MRDFLEGLEAEIHRAALRQEDDPGRAVPGVRRRLPSLRGAAAPVLALTAAVALIGLVVVPAVRVREGAPAAPSPDGRYVSGVVLTERASGGSPGRSSLELAKGTFGVRSGIFGLQGTTELDGDTIRFRSPSGFHYLPRRANTAGGLPAGSEGCIGPAATGEYRWRLADGALVLELVSDPCPPRARLLDGEWAPAPGDRSG